VYVEHFCKEVKISIERYYMEVNVMSIELHDFDLILGMDWLSNHKAQIYCFSKTMTLQGSDGKIITFRGERNVMPNCVISVMTVSKLMRKRCMAYLAYIIDSEKKNEVEFNNIPIMREFSDVFPEELSGLPLEREVEVSIDILLGISPTTWAPAELVELKVQLQKLLQRGFIHPSSLPWGALVLFFYFYF
jgi:hypothetical protein